jgi:hypothetical protein
MAVVINEFETTAAPAPAPAQARGDQPQSKADDAKGDPVKEVVRKLHLHAERARRLWVY